MEIVLIVRRGRPTAFQARIHNGGARCGKARCACATAASKRFAFSVYGRNGARRAADRWLTRLVAVGAVKLGRRRDAWRPRFRPRQ